MRAEANGTASVGAPPWIWLAAVAALSMVVHLDLIHTGLMSDDFLQQAMIEGWFVGERNFWDLYRFYTPDPEEFEAHRTIGSLPWWANPDLRGAMLRPFASTLLHLDHALFPRNWAAHHVHSLLWWGAAVFGAGMVLCRALGRRIGLLALALFAFDPACIVPLAWLANRCVLQSAAFCFFGLYAYMREPTPGRRAVAFCLLGLSLLAGEYGLVTCAYFVAYDLVSARGESRDRWKDRLRAATPVILIALVYLTVHRLLGYGNNGAAVYVDPTASFVEFLRNSGSRFARLCGQMWLSLPAASVDFRHALGDLDAGPFSRAAGADAFIRAHAILGAAGSLGFFAACWPLWNEVRAAERRPVAWLGLGALLGLVPLLAGPAHGRLLILALLGASAVSACVMVAAVRRLRDRSQARRRRVLGLGVLLVAGVLQLGGDLYGNHHATSLLAVTQSTVRQAFASTRAMGIDLDGADIILTSSLMQTPAFDGVAYMRLTGQPTPRSWQTLSIGYFPYTFVPLNEHEIEVRAVGNDEWMCAIWERFFRVPGDSFPVDGPVRTGELTYEIVEVGAEGPTRIRFAFDRRLSEYVWLATSRDGLEPFLVPGIGKTGVVRRP